MDAAAPAPDAAGPVRTRPRGLALRGRLVPAWDSAGEHPYGEVVVVDGVVAAAGPVPERARDLPVLGGPGAVLGPGLVDAHVHLAFGAPEQLLRGGVVAARDLGAPLADALRWRAEPLPPVLAVAGPLLGAPGGYPSRSWGAGGFARGVADPAHARAVVHELAGAGVDLLKLALEPAGGPVPDLATARAVVDAAHEEGLAVTCHALRPEMVERALDAGVDELCHVPDGPLPQRLVDRLARAGTPVVSTLHTHVDHGRRAGVLPTARALVAAGVPLVYGTDLGNAGTSPGADARELELLALAGLGPTGALAAASTGAAALPGLAGRVTGRIELGRPAALVVLDGDPRADPRHVERPRAVAVGERLLSR